MADRPSKKHAGRAAKSAGTGASKSASRRAKKPEQRRSGSRVRPNGATVMVTLVVVLGIAVLAPTAQRFISQRQQVAQLQAELQETQQSVESIQSERDRWSDPAYIQSQARGRLLFVMPGDTSYLVIDPPSASRSQQQNISEDLHVTKSNWLETFAQSLVTAGTSDAPAPTP